MDKKYKQSSETLDYDIKGDDWLAEGDIITSVITTVVTPISASTPLLIVSATVFLAGMRVKLLISGGVNGVKYKVTVRLATQNGLIKEFDFYMQIKDI
jgi:hypothetical protein